MKIRTTPKKGAEYCRVTPQITLRTSESILDKIVTCSQTMGRTLTVESLKEFWAQRPLEGRHRTGKYLGWQPPLLAEAEK